MKNRKTYQLKAIISEIKNTYCLNPQKSWNNTNNANTYKQMPLTSFRRGAMQGGLDTGCDIKAIAKYVNNAHSLLEVGAGYGRALNCIIKNNYKEKLFAIEREPKLCAFLKKHFPQVHIINTDIRIFTTKYKFDLILWLWAGLSEFSQTEQLPTLKNLVAHLAPKGHLIIDSISIDCKTIKAIAYDKHNRIIKTPYGNDFIYLPSDREIKLYARKLNLLKKEIIIYTTKTKKKRNLYVFQNP